MPARCLKSPHDSILGLATGLTLAAACLFGASSCEGVVPPPYGEREAPPPKLAERPAGPASYAESPPEAPPEASPVRGTEEPQEVPLDRRPDATWPESEIRPRKPAQERARSGAHEGGDYAGWGTYRMGRASFRYPKGWSVQNTAYGVEVTPAGSRPGQELILVTANPAPGVREGTDERVGRALDSMIAASMPAMRRRGRPKKVSSNIGSGGRFDYAGRIPDGRRAEGSVYVAVESGKAAAISIVADRARLEERRSDVEKIFQSFESGTGGRRPVGAGPDPTKELDPRLIGMFAGEVIHSGDGVYVNTRLVYALGSDGVLHYGAQSALNASKGSGSGGFRWTATGISGGKVKRGTWSAQGGQLTVEWDSGKVGTVAYGFEPDGTLALRDPFTKKLINIYDRVQ